MGKISEHEAMEEIEELLEDDKGISLYLILSAYPCLVDMCDRVQRKDINNVMLDDEIEQLIKILTQYKKNNALIIGKAGIGKTALVESLCQRINRHDVPTSLRNKKIIELSLGDLIANTRYRGEFEGRLTSIINLFKGRDDVILFIDEVHNIVDAGGADGAIAMGDIIKPYIARGDITIIGATTYQEYLRTIYKDKALKRRFTIVDMSEPSLKVVKDILENSRKDYEEHYNVRLSSNDISRVVMRSYFRDGNYPDKAFDELEDYCYEKVKRGK